ncbi:hypothetical protein AMJ47_03995 [Parcubacteria bacterium DG_72]|nr:MAG: hypothetical protein AMJ47_03995 [Parcubacteria bacterium DG_72]
MKRRNDITEKDLAKSKLFTDEEMRFARVILGLPSAGQENSATRKWFKGLGGGAKYGRLFKSVNEKINKIRAGD